MLEGGYLLIGFTQNGKDFKIQNLDKKDDEYLLKYFKFLDSTENNQIFDFEEIFEIDESPKQLIKPRVLEIIEREYTKNNNLKIYVDTTQILNLPDYTDNLELNEKIKSGTGDIIEYSNSIKESYSKYYLPSEKQKQAYPLLVYNKTDSIIPIETKEGWIYMIQEAKDKQGKWKPIEYFNPHTFCGNSFGFNNLLPNHFVISKIYKYSGDFKTKIRIKFTTNKNVYYSNEFIGEINLEQFELPNQLKKIPINKRHYYFFNNRKK